MIRPFASRAAGAAIGAAIALSFAVPAGSSGNTHDDSDYILSRGALAIGGRENLAKVHGIQVSGRVRSGSRTGLRRTWLDFAGGRFRVDSETDPRARRLAFDGKTAMRLPAAGPAARLDGVDLDEARADFFVRSYEIFAGPTRRAAVTSLPDRRRGDLRDHVVQVTCGRAEPRVLVFDGETYFLKSIETGPDSARTVLELDSYRDINDVLYPFHERLTRPGGEVEEYDVTETRLNPVFADSVFHPRALSRRAPRRSFH